MTRMIPASKHTTMIGQRVLIGNVNYRILDKVEAPRYYQDDAGSRLLVCTQYLALDEKDNLCLILPEHLEVFELDPGLKF